MPRIRVVVTDDHPMFRFGMAALLGSVGDIEVVGEAGSGDEAVALVETLQPDVILMDLTMPGMGGIEATRRIVATAPAIAILVVTMVDEDDAVFAAMRVGARGYLVKGADQDEVLRAIRAVAGGEAIFGHAVARRRRQAAPPAPVPGAARRQRG